MTDWYALGLIVVEGETLGLDSGWYRFGSIAGSGAIIVTLA